MKKKRPATDTKPHGRYSVPVVRSTFRILEELSHAEALGLKEITQITRIPKSTVFRILSTLLEMGYIVRDADRNYRISVTLGRLVSDEANGEALRSLARPYMLELRDKYGETVNLGVRNFDKITYLEVVPSEFALRLQEARGVSVPAHATALGKSILAFTPQNLVEDVIRGQKLEIVTQNTISDPKEFFAELKRVRALGYAIDRGEASLLATCLGAPILDAHGIAIASMSISGPASRFILRKDSPVITSLLRATTELSRQFVPARDN